MTRLNQIALGLMLLCCPLWGCDDGGGSAASVDSGSTDAGASDGGTMGDGGSRADVAAPDPVPNLDVAPPSLTLPGTAGMASDPQALTLTNSGDGPLTISSLTIEPADEAEHFALIDAPALPAVIQAGASLELSVTYTAPDPMEHGASLVIQSDDPDAAVISIPLTGRVFESCIRAMPNTLDLGAVDPGIRSGRFEFRIINCGDTEHTIDTIMQEGDERFNWTTIGNPPAEGRTLRRGDSVSIGVTYQNVDLALGESASGRLIIPFTGNSTRPLTINLRATGGEGGDRCLVRLEPESIDFEILRIGLERSVELSIFNRGNGPCDLREVSVTNTRGEEQNLFSLAQGLEPQILEPMSEHTVTITYSPTVPNPVGEQGILSVQYFDEFLNMNRAEEVILRGIGAEALVGSVPENLYFDKVTATECASRRLRIGAENVGFVPICATDYRIEGPDCDRFKLIESPEIDGCLSLERGEAAAYIIQFEPNLVGEATCNIIVSSDAQNMMETTLALRGDGVEDHSRRDEFEVGRLNPVREAKWRLRLQAVPESVRVFVNDEQTENFEFDADENEIVIGAMHLPERGDALRVEYDAFCHPRRCALP